MKHSTPADRAMPTLLTRLTDAPPPPAQARFGWPNEAALLAGVGTVLAVPGAYGALVGCFLIVPPLLFVAGMVLLAGYYRVLARKQPRPASRGFWLFSAAYNILLALATCAVLVSALADRHGPSGFPLAVLAALLWQGTAAALSLRAARNPRFCREA
jgi:hypothetical protein